MREILCIAEDQYMATGFVDQSTSSGIDQDPFVVVQDAIDAMPDVNIRCQIHLFPARIWYSDAYYIVVLMCAMYQDIAHLLATRSGYPSIPECHLILWQYLGSGYYGYCIPC